MATARDRRQAAEAPMTYPLGHPKNPHTAAANAVSGVGPSRRVPSRDPGRGSRAVTKPEEPKAPAAPTTPGPDAPTVQGSEGNAGATPAPAVLNAPAPAAPAPAGNVTEKAPAPAEAAKAEEATS